MGNMPSWLGGSRLWCTRMRDKDVYNRGERERAPPLMMSTALASVRPSVRARVSERWASMQGEERESMLERDRVRVSERRASMQGEERESILEHDRVRQSERRSAQQYRRVNFHFFGNREWCISWLLSM